MVWAKSVVPNLTYRKIFENLMGSYLTCTCFWTLKVAVKASLLIPWQRFAWKLMTINMYYNAQVQITDFSRFGSVRFGMVTVLSIVWPLSLLLCSFHKKLRIWEIMSFVKQMFVKQIIRNFSRVDTDVLMEVAYSCNFLAVSDSSTCPDIGTSWCHAGIIEHFEIRGFKMTP